MSVSMRALHTIALLVALLCGACAPLAPREAEDASQSRSTPQWIGDDRPEIAALLQSELLRWDWMGDPDARHWLRGVAGIPADAAEIDNARERFSARAASTAVLIVPGLLGDCVSAQAVPFGDGVARTAQSSLTDAYRIYDDLRLYSIRAVRLPGRGRSEANGRLLAEEIRIEAARSGVERIMLVAYSKGAPDTMHALAQLQSAGGLPDKVKAFVAVSGAVGGSPLAEALESWYEALSPHYGDTDCVASDGREVLDLNPEVRRAWLRTHALPASIAYYSITAQPLPEDMSLPLRPLYRRLSEIDPRNDGMVLARDAILPESRLLASAQADHWTVVLPFEKHPNPLFRTLVAGPAYPREALLRAVIIWVVGRMP